MDWRSILDNLKSPGVRLSPADAVVLYRDAPLHSIRSAALMKPKQIIPISIKNSDVRLIFFVIEYI